MKRIAWQWNVRSTYLIVLLLFGGAFPFTYPPFHLEEKKKNVTHPNKCNPSDFEATTSHGEETKVWGYMYQCNLFQGQKTIRKSQSQ